MNISNIDDLRKAVKGNTKPIKAIRLKCLDCSCYSITEVTKCTVTDCPLYPFRMGKNPFTKKRVLSEEQKQALADGLRKYKEKQQTNVDINTEKKNNKQ